MEENLSQSLASTYTLTRSLPALCHFTSTPAIFPKTLNSGKELLQEYQICLKIKISSPNGGENMRPGVKIPEGILNEPRYLCMNLSQSNM